MNDIIYCDINTQGLLCNQLYSVLTVYRLSSIRNIKHIYVVDENYGKYLFKMNLNEYVKNIKDISLKKLTHHELRLSNPYMGYGVFNRDFNEQLLSGFITDTILKDELFKKEFQENDNKDGLAIHIRATDYLNDNYKFNFNEYLKIAFKNYSNINRIDVYSDDIDYVLNIYENILKENFKDIRYIKRDTILDLYRLSTYKNKILWNSTYSYWSAYISNVLYRNYQNITVPDFHFKLLNGGYAWHLNPKWNIIKVIR